MLFPRDRCVIYLRYQGDFYDLYCVSVFDLLSSLTTYRLSALAATSLVACEYVCAHFSASMSSRSTESRARQVIPSRSLSCWDCVFCCWILMTVCVTVLGSLLMQPPESSIFASFFRLMRVYAADRRSSDWPWTDWTLSILLPVGCFLPLSRQADC